MEKVVVDPVDNVVMLHSTMWDQCITGHIDRSIVDGKVCKISKMYPTLAGYIDTILFYNVGKDFKCN